MILASRSIRQFLLYKNAASHSLKAKLKNQTPDICLVGKK